MKPRFLLPFVLLMWCAVSFAQPIELPPLSIDATRLDCSVTYDGARRVYRYLYSIDAPPENKVAVALLLIDISGRIARPQLDPDLTNNVVRDEAAGEILQPMTTIPVGLQVPDPALWSASVGQPAWVGIRKRFGGLPPGSSATGLVIESKLPPGVRKAWLHPSESTWSRITLGSPPGTEFHPDSAEAYEVQTEIVAPSDPDEATLFLGGGQSPREVNPILRYAAPTESRTNLQAGTSSYRVIVFYGATIDPSTFSAELNRSSVTSLFHPIPGAAEVVTIPLVPGTNKLQLSVEGTTSGGRAARDTDTLTFLVE